MRIVLINPRTGNPHTKPPLGLLSIGTVCKKAGHNVTILDAALLDLQAEEISNQVGNADLVGITAMSPYIYGALAIAAEFRATRVPVVIGGVHATLFPDSMYLTGLFKAVIVGEGEELILKLLNDLANNNVKPIYRTVKQTCIPTPDYSLIDINAYQPQYPHAKRLPWVSAQTSRGCPYSCTFCCNIFGHNYRYMPTSQIGFMVDGLVTTYGVKDITFYDDEFTLDHSHVLTLCKLLESRNYDITWTCEARVDLVDAELLKIMAKAGCRLIYYGIESGNQGILDKLDKRITLGQVERAVKLTQKAGIEVAGYFMLGCPGETKGTIKQTVAFARALDLNHAQFSICSPLPGTKLWGRSTNGKPWNEYQYLGNGKKAICPTMLSYNELEEAVAKANEMFKGGISE